MVALFQPPALHVTRDERRSDPDRSRTAQEYPLLAAQQLSLALRDRGDVDVAQAGANFPQNFGKHLVLEMPDASGLRPGDEVQAIPTHICPTVAMHQFAYVIEGGKLAGTWEIVGRNRVLSL